MQAHCKNVSEMGKRVNGTGRQKERRILYSAHLSYHTSVAITIA